jgi:hypothetical protein
LIIPLIIVFLIMPFASSAHYIVGVVENSKDGADANGFQVVLWNPAIGIQDNQTDIVGTIGNSGNENTYFIDCEMLSNGCNIGDTINIKIFNNGSNRLTNTSSVVVTGAGYDLAPTLILNSFPLVQPSYPVNYFNSSKSKVNLTCYGSDLDNNLANITLYGNFSGQWLPQQTITVSGNQSVNFTVDLIEGKYLWSCLATDDLSISSFANENQTITVDLTPPTIQSMYLSLNQDICGTSETIRINCTTSDTLTGIENVWITSTINSISTNHSTSILSGQTYYADIALNEIGDWDFQCFSKDYSGNEVSSQTESIKTIAEGVDLYINSQQIILSNNNPIETENVTFTTTIENLGCSDANNVLISLYQNNLTTGLIQEKTLSITNRSNIQTNFYWIGEIGNNELFIFADSNQQIPEENENNNIGNKTIFISAWQKFYGNLSLDKLLASYSLDKMNYWANSTIERGNIFIADLESEINWHSLKAISKKTNDDDSLTDFQNIDLNLNMESLNDSISNLFTTNGITAKETKNFTVFGQQILNVPITPSANNTNFYTGILWDTSQDTDGFYSGNEQEDLVFITEINKGQTGSYGLYDYEIRIPGRLREYHPDNTHQVFIYFDLE